MIREEVSHTARHEHEEQTTELPTGNDRCYFLDMYDV